MSVRPVQGGERDHLPSGRCLQEEGFDQGIPPCGDGPAGIRELRLGQGGCLGESADRLAGDGQSGAVSLTR